MDEEIACIAPHSERTFDQTCDVCGTKGPSTRQHCRKRLSHVSSSFLRCIAGRCHIERQHGQEDRRINKCGREIGSGDGQLLPHLSYRPETIALRTCASLRYMYATCSRGVVPKNHSNVIYLTSNLTTSLSTLSSELHLEDVA